MTAFLLGIATGAVVTYAALNFAAIKAKIDSFRQ